MSERYTSFLPVLTLLAARRKGEPLAQWNKRFMRAQRRYGEVLHMRARVEEANLRERRARAVSMPTAPR